MRSTLTLGLAAVLTTALLAPAAAEAGGRRRVRPVGIAPTATGLVRSDDALRALLAATPAGGTLNLPAGAFRTALVIDRPMTVVGAAAGTTLDATDLGRPALRIAAGVRGVALEAFRVMGATGDGILAEGRNDRLRLVRVAVRGCGAAGLRVIASDDVTIDTSSFEGNAGPGLDLDGERARLVRCGLRANGLAGARLRGLGAAVRECAFDAGSDGLLLEGAHADVFRCTFRGFGVGVRVGGGCEGATISRCDGLGLRSLVVAEAGSSGARVLENRMLGATGDAFRLGGDDHRADGNAIEGALGAGIAAIGDRAAITGNRIEDTNGAGVALDGDFGAALGNTVRRCGVGVRVVSGSGNRVEANSCEGCLGPDLVDDGRGTTVGSVRVP